MGLKERFADPYPTSARGRFYLALVMAILIVVIRLLFGDTGLIVFVGLAGLLALVQAFGSLD